MWLTLTTYGEFDYFRSTIYVLRSLLIMSFRSNLKPLRFHETSPLVKKHKHFVINFQTCGGQQIYKT
ncbi:MAG: hypothetical protein ACTS4X_00320 [Candidatus Hodgkinia cicadicola]